MQVKKIVLRITSLSAATAILAASSMAGACSFYAPIAVDQAPEDYRAECRLLLRNQDRVLTELRSGTRDYDEIALFAGALRDGSANCPERADFAFAMYDASLGSPIRTRERGGLDREFRKWAQDTLSAERLSEVIAGTWIMGPAENWYGGPCGASTYYADKKPDDVSNATLREYLVKPEYWAEAVRQFGNNPARDRMVLEEIIDPSSALFDLSLAARLGPRFHLPELTLAEGRGERKGKPTRIAVAEALANPQFGTPDYEAAASLLSNITPYRLGSLSPEDRARALRLWTRIGQSRLSSPDPAVRGNAELFLRTGDMSAKLGMPLKDVLPAGADLILLDDWPEDVLPLQDRFRAAERIAEDYPSRALRANEAGRVELGALFGADGSFHGLHVTRRTSSKSLDDAALRSTRRYLLGNTDTMHLPDYTGSYVFAPLPAFEYYIYAGEVDPPTAIGEVPDDVFRIVASQPVPY